MALDNLPDDVPTIADLVSEAIRSGRVASERDIARKLKAGSAIVGDWKSGRSYPRNNHAIGLAKLAGRDPVEVLAIVNYWRSKPADRIYIRRMLGYIRAGLAAALLLFFVLPESLHGVQHSVQKITAPIHYARLKRAISHYFQCLKNISQFIGSIGDIA